MSPISQSQDNFEIKKKNILLYIGPCEHICLTYAFLAGSWAPLLGVKTPPLAWISQLCLKSIIAFHTLF